METLVVVVPHQHRNQYYCQSKAQISNGFGSSPSKGFRDMSCRSEGILPTPCRSPFKSITRTISPSPKTPKHVPFTNEETLTLSQTETPLRNKGKSHSIPINFNKIRSFNDEFSYSDELWAGPTYCNSPPPSSLPIPKFSLRQKRSVSFELPVPPKGISLPTVVKSAPPSPSREPFKAFNSSFYSTDNATKDLRRILHLDED